MSSITVTVNGEARELAAGSSVADLIEQMGLSGKRLAVEIDQEIVPRSQHASTKLAAGNRIEVVHAIGGG